MTTSPDVDPRPVLDLIEAFRRSKTMFAAVELRVFDRLSEGPLGARQLAPDGNADAMQRLLDACVSLGLLRRNGDLYENSELSATYLSRSSPRALAGYISYSNQVLYPMWAHLEDAVREGTHRWKQAFGLDGGIFAHFYKTDAARREFLLGMHGNGLLSSPAVVAAFDLSPYRRIVDLGGATGHLALAAVRRYPGMRGAVFDLPDAIRFAREFVEGSPEESARTMQPGRHGEPGSPPRAAIELIEGDFFTDPLPEADLYAVGQILHDWTEEKIERLLERIYEALPPGGALLIAEKLLDADLRGPVSAHMQSLNMMICTEGRERSALQYADLLEKAGFRHVDAKKTGARLDAVLAKKT